jgi:integrase/recombinase XerD
MRLVRRYALALGLKIGAHALRATAATNALDHDADIAKVEGWLGHANIAATRIYDRRKMKPEDSPTFKVSYLMCSRRGRRTVTRHDDSRKRQAQIS